jgi:RNA polymerase sigma-70 factor (ECF subfamily)
MELYEASQLITQLFNSDYPILLRYALQATHDLEMAEDVVQEAMMSLYKELRAGKHIDNPKAWMFCVVRRLISKRVRVQRTQGLHEPLSTINDTVASPMAAEEGHGPDELSNLLAVLTPREQEVILLRMTALKYREIANRLGISPKSVNTFLTRALRKLQKAVKASSKTEIESRYVEPPNPKTLH